MLTAAGWDGEEQQGSDRDAGGAQEAVQAAGGGVAPHHAPHHAPHGTLSVLASLRFSLCSVRLT